MQQMSDDIMTRETQRVEYHNERARQLGLPATLLPAQWIETLSRFQWMCAYCAGPYEVLEHFIPLALQSETSVHNCLPSCLLCNARKQDTHPGALSWVAPSMLLYIRSYFASLHTGANIAPLIRDASPVVVERPDAIHTVKDLIARFKVSERTIKRFMQDGKLQGTMVHGTWRFSEEDCKSQHYSGENPTIILVSKLS